MQNPKIQSFKSHEVHFFVNKPLRQHTPYEYMYNKLVGRGAREVYEYLASWHRGDS